MNTASTPQSRSIFTDLCPDILFDLFSYFSLNELVDSFSALLPSLARLLVQGHVPLFMGESLDEHFWTNFFPQLDPQQMITLTVSHLRFNHMDFSQYMALSSITLEDVVGNNPSSPFPWDRLQQLPRLQRFIVRLSKTTHHEQHWLLPILCLRTIKHVHIESVDRNNTIRSQRPFHISHVVGQSCVVTSLHIRIPLRWTSIFTLLSHFPVLRRFRAYLYRMEHHSNDILLLTPKLDCFATLRTLDLIGYFAHMSSIITLFCSSIPNLTSCRFLSTSATQDSITEVLYLRQHFFGRRLFQLCLQLNRVKIHMLMSIEANEDIDTERTRTLLRAFNDDSFCRKYHFSLLHRSRPNGYMTLICDFHRGNKWDSVKDELSPNQRCTLRNSRDQKVKTIGILIVFTTNQSEASQIWYSSISV